MQITGRQLRAAISLAGIPYKTAAEGFGMSEQGVKQLCKRIQQDRVLLIDNDRLRAIVKTLKKYNVRLLPAGAVYMGEQQYVRAKKFGATSGDILSASRLEEQTARC